MRGGGKFETNPATRDPTWVKIVVLGVGLSYFVLFLLLPLLAVFAEALRKGFDAYVAALIEPDALSAVQSDFAGGRDRRAVELGFWFVGRMGDREVPISR